METQRSRRSKLDCEVGGGGAGTAAFFRILAVVAVVPVPRVSVRRDMM